MAASGEVAYEDHFDALTFHFTGAEHVSLAGARTLVNGPRLDVAGWGMVVAGMVWIVALAHPSFHYSMHAWFIYLVWFGIAAMLIVRGRPVRTTERVELIRMDASTGAFSVRHAPWHQQPDGEWSADSSEVDEVLFATRRRWLDERSSMETFGVFIRLRDGRVWPVVPMLDDQKAAFQAANMISRRVEARVKQVGVNWGQAQPQRVMH